MSIDAVYQEAWDRAALTHALDDPAFEAAYLDHVSDLLTYPVPLEPVMTTSTSYRPSALLRRAEDALLAGARRGAQRLSRFNRELRIEMAARRLADAQRALMSEDLDDVIAITRRTNELLAARRSGGAS